MDNINNESYINLKNTYDNLNYFDQYGSSVVLFILITISLFILCSYCFVMINVEPIKEDWINQRCKPSIIPFAGLINAPEGMSSSDFTKENFDIKDPKNTKEELIKLIKTKSYPKLTLKSVLKYLDENHGLGYGIKKICPQVGKCKKISKCGGLRITGKGLPISLYPSDSDSDSDSEYI
jgi:hypothetical protein